MFHEDSRFYERLTPFEQIVDLDFSFEDGVRRIDGATIDDRLYGTFEFDADVPGDKLLIDLLMSEPVQRLQYIQQLILPEQFATRPETADFTRLEHSIGCMLLARKLGGSIEQQTRALLHDVAQTAFSHLGDWLKQGMDGPDNHHDDIQIEYMKQWGIDEVFAANGFDFDSFFESPPADFVERPAPDLCVDRVDYSLREFARWTCPDDVARLVDELVVKDDMIAFTSHESAVIFADGYEQLFLWHWAHDEHAVREKLFLTMIQQGIEEGVITEDDMYSVDPQVMAKLEMWGGEVTYTLGWLLRQKDITLSHIKGTAESLSLDKKHMERDEHSIYVMQRPFKTRWVNPSFVEEDGTRLSLAQVDGDFRTKLQFFLEMVDYEFQERWQQQFGEALLHFVQIEVEPDVKQILSGVGDIR